MSAYDANNSHAQLVGMLGAIRAMKPTFGVDLSPHQELFLEHFGAMDKAAREGGRLPDAWHAKPGMQTDHPHMTVLASSGDRVISEENRNILKEKCSGLRSAVEEYKSLKSSGGKPEWVLEALERVADEANNVAKHIQILGVVDGLFDGWEI